MPSIRQPACARISPQRTVRNSASADSAIATPGMSDIVIEQRAKVRAKTERPRLYKVILINDDYTPREFVVRVLKAVFRMSESQAYAVMITAHRRGSCV